MELRLGISPLDNFNCRFLQFSFVIFWQEKIGEKAARKMLLKLTKGLIKLLIIEKI